MTVDDLVSWGWSTTLASTGVVIMYWIDVIAGAVLLVLGLAGMHIVRVRFSRRAALAQSSSRVGQGDDHGQLRRRRLATAPRATLFEALSAAGLLVVTTSSGTTEAWQDLLAQHTSSLGPYLVGALSRRVRYLARAVPRPAADEIVALLAAAGSGPTPNWPATDMESTVVEVFDAGPPMRGGPWR